MAKGNSKFLEAFIDKYPDIIREADNNGYSIFHIAILNLQGNVFELNDIGQIKDMIVSSRDNNENLKFMENKFYFLLR